jgi:hypothetical protein
MVSWKQNKKIGIIAGVIIVVAVIFIILKLFSFQKTPILLGCEKTGKVFIGYVTPKTTYPTECPDGDKDAYPVEIVRLANGQERVIFIKGAGEELNRLPQGTVFVTKNKLNQLLGNK